MEGEGKVLKELFNNYYELFIPLDDGQGDQPVEDQTYVYW